jgi:hypothetical protein
MNSKGYFVQHLLNMPVARLVEFIYWDNHGGGCMDIEPSDWTMAMVIDAITADDDDWQDFSDAYALFLTMP